MLKNYIINVLLISTVIFISSCAYSPASELLKKGESEISISLGVPVYWNYSIIGFTIAAFPVVGYKYGINDNFNFYIRNYSAFFYSGILFIDTGIAGRLYSFNSFLHLNGLFGIDFIAKMAPSFEGVQLYANSGLVMIIGESEKSNLYFGCDIIAFPAENSFDVNANLRLGGVIRFSENWGMNIEASLNSLGRTFMTLGSSPLQGIGFPVVYIGTSFKFGGKK